MRRIEAEELLDEHDAPPDDVERSLRDLRRINAYLGGTRAFRQLLARLVSPDRAFDILDLGTGTSDLLEALPNARRFGLDFKIGHLLYGRALATLPVRRIAGDAFRLPFRDASFDIVTSSHFFHHFTPDENADILRDSLRVARVGVAVTDTRRHIAPLAFVRLLGLTPLVGRITRFDAPASVMQGYTLEEARAIAARAGGRDPRVFRLMPFRFGLLLWK
jgi:ubiquinone/menaquinone biosynthesis C-methylase UbiE